MAVPEGWRLLLDDLEERLAFLDDVRGHFDRDTVANIAHRVNDTVRHGQSIPGIAHPVRLAIDLVLQRPLQNANDLLAMVVVPDRRRVRGDLHPCLDDLTPGNAEILLLQIGAPQSGCASTAVSLTPAGLLSAVLIATP